MSLSDAHLVARVIANDDRNAFAELVRRNQSSVRSLLRRLTCGDAALADDLAQETFIRAFRSVRTYRGTAKFSSWMYRIAYNVFLSEKSKRREEPSEELEQQPASSQMAGSSALKVDLNRAMIALNPAERAVVTLSFAMEASHQEVATILDCPLGTVKTHIMRARQKLQAQLRAWRQPEFA